MVWKSPNRQRTIALMPKRKGKHPRKAPPKSTDRRKVVSLDEQLGDHAHYDALSRQIYRVSNIDENYRKRRTQIP